MSVSSPLCPGHGHSRDGVWEMDRHGLLDGARACWQRRHLVLCFSNLNMGSC